MALQKQPLSINFAQGLDLKTDPNQVAPGKFLALENSVFSKIGRLQKRNGFMLLPSVTGATSLSSYASNLLALGSTLQVYSPDTATWLNRGGLATVSLSTLPVLRNSSTATACDVAVASNKLACAVFVQGGLSYYQIVDSTTGQIVVQTTALAASAALPRVFILGSYFVITYLVTIAGTSLYYVAIPTANPTLPGSATSLTSTASSLAAGYDGVVANGYLYLSWDANDGGGAIRSKTMDSSLTQSSVVAIAGKTSTLMSVTADNSTGGTPEIYVTYYAANNAYTTVYDANLNLIGSASHQTINTITCNTITSVATAGGLQLFYEQASTYSYTPTAPGAAKSDLINQVSMARLGTVGTPSVVLRSVGLASKAFYIGTTAYMLATYGGVYQPTFFLIDSSGNVAAKLAYSNGGGYMSGQVLPSVSIDSDDIVQIGYLFKSSLTAANKTQGSAATSLGVYSQLGVNLASFTFGIEPYSSELAQALHLSGGYVTQYDGVKPVEHGFHLWPEDILISTATGSGSLSAQDYYYQVTYEWTDGQGHLHRSAPSIPMKQTTTTASSTNTIKIPTLRITSKLAANPIRIVIYRWSTAQQIYYQLTSITSPTLNSTSSDSVTYTDSVADASILGNQIIYTTGGVVEDIAAPATDLSCIFKTRLFIVDAEDPNLLWFSKQVIEDVPVEFSDLFTLYVSPNIGAQGNTGPVTALNTLDDKLAIFKKNAIYTLTGIGPDNAGANNDFNDPTFVTSTVGCDNPKSIVMIPKGLMFQSDKGIWLLSRDLNTTYIGAPVEAYNGDTVVSALNVPGTNQVRFTLDSGVTLVYDYYMGQWGTFVGIPGVSSVLFENLHTFLDSYGRVFQESEGSYLDASRPVLMKFTTSWLNLAGLQGYERAYFFSLLGTYITPHKLSVSMAYDYNASPTQVSIITPDNYSGYYGGDTLYGGSGTYGGVSDIEQWRVFLKTQQCQAVQVTIEESYDPSYSVPAGAGFTMSGLNFVLGIKKGYKPFAASKSVG